MSRNQERVLLIIVSVALLTLLIRSEKTSSPATKRNQIASSVPAKISLTLVPSPGYATYKATWPLSVGATGYRIWQAEGSGPSQIVALTTLRAVSLSLPCGKTTRSNVGPVNSAGAAPLAPPVYVQIPSC